MPLIRVALAQIDLGVGSFESNLVTIGNQIELAKEAKANLVVFPSLTTSGYPPGDLIFRESFVAENLACLDELAKLANGIDVLAGFIERLPNGDLHNSMAFCVDGEVQTTIRKTHISADHGFIEARYFRVANTPAVEAVVNVGSHRVGVSFGWSDAERLVDELGASGLDLILNVEPYSFFPEAASENETAAANFSGLNAVAAASLNTVGAHDELIFAGGSFATNEAGEVVVRAASYQSDLVMLQIEQEDGFAHLVPGRIEQPLSEVESLYQALLLGTRDYIYRNGFTEVLVSLSGGVDSAVVAALACDALGPERVQGVMLPSRYSSQHSVTDAVALAENLGISYRVIEIEPAYAAFLDLLEPHFIDRQFDVTEENLQARIRGVIVMALSNKFGWLVLTGSNKTELAVGYSTMYGDAVGGLSILADVPKLSVYALAEHHNQVHGFPSVPESILTKAPSAELRPGQSDEQSLPPYDILDPLMMGLVEHHRSVREMVAQGFDEGTVQRVASLIDNAEFKRRQAPPVLKASRRPFGVDRNMPMTHKFRG